MMQSDDSHTSDSNHSSFLRPSDFHVAAVLLVVMVVLAVARSMHYLMFHTMAELLAIVVSLCIFVLTWLSSRYLSNGYLIVLGGSYAAVAAVDLFHTLTFQGMNLFPGVSTNYPTQFWLSARFLEAMALFLAAFFIDRKPSFAAVSVVFSVLGIAACSAVIQQWFPPTFIDGVGLTPFKIYSEYAIIALLAGGLVMLWHFRNRFEPRIFILLLTSLLLAIATEICFTRYVDFFDFNNELGHYLRFLSVAFAFMAIVISGVHQPFELIFREIAQSKRALGALNNKLLESEGRLAQAQRVAQVGSWYHDIRNNTHTWSDETYRIFGLPVGSALLPDTFANCIHPDDREAVFFAWHRALEGQPYDIEHRIIAAGQTRWVREVAEMSFAADGTPVAGLGTVQDITERKHVQLALQSSEQRMVAVFQASPIGIVISRLSDGMILDVNDAALQQFAYTREQVIGKRSVSDLAAYLHPQQRDQMIQLLGQTGRIQQMLVDFKTNNDQHKVMEVSGRIIELQGEACVLSMMADVTERQRTEALIHEQAFRDSLTHLPNRRLLVDRLTQTMAAAKRSGCYGALLFLDLDNFKPLNDTHGHEIGDLLLIEVARRLTSCVREMDTVARVGGDEFVVMLSELSTQLDASKNQALAIAEKVRARLASPYFLISEHEKVADNAIEHHCTVSIGAALFVSDNVSHKEIIRLADEAMYQAKRAGRNSIRFHDGYN